MRYFIVLICLMLTSSLQAKPTEIVFWHSLAGDLGLEIQIITDGFNKSQSKYRIKPIYKGEYTESLTSYAAAFRAHQPPAMVQVFEVGTATMLSPKGIIKPLHELMSEQHLSLPEADFLSTVRSYYSEKGQLMAMPLNISIPVVFYNADALERVGYPKGAFPNTWDELDRLATKLKKSGFSCVYTTAYPAWLLIESFSAIHGLPIANSEGTKAIYNDKKLIDHLSRLKNSHYFQYGGRSDDATVLFSSGRCPMFTQSSGAYHSLSSLVPFKVGMAAVPLDTRVSKKRFNNIIGGGAVWVTSGQTPDVYQGIANFFVYLAQPSVQEQWHQHTGYLPLGVKGIYAPLAKASHHPSLILAKQEASHEPNKIFPLGAQHQIRIVNDEALEEIFAGINDAQHAMDNAVAAANNLLLRFERNTQGSDVPKVSLQPDLLKDRRKTGESLIYESKFRRD